MQRAKDRTQRAGLATTGARLPAVFSGGIQPGWKPDLDQRAFVEEYLAQESKPSIWGAIAERGLSRAFWRRCKSDPSFLAWFHAQVEHANRLEFISLSRGILERAAEEVKDGKSGAVFTKMAVELYGPKSRVLDDGRGDKLPQWFALIQNMHIHHHEKA